MTFLRRATIDVADGANLDAFSRLRVSDPTTLFAAQCQYDADPLVFETGNTGTGVAPAHSANDRMVTLTCNAGSGTSFIQSYEYVPYQAGKSQLVFMTGLLGAAVANVTVDAGLFDASNGIFLRQNGTTDLRLIRRTRTGGSVVDNAVSQSAWNLDKLDGTGTSGLTLDVTKVFILLIDAQFLGMGRVRVGFDIDGTIVYVHEFLNANVLTVPYIQTLTLPVQMLVTSTASAGAKSAKFKCASVSSEGGLSEDLQYEFVTTDVEITAASTGFGSHIQSIRPKLTFNGLTNRSRIIVKSIDILVVGNQPIIWGLYVGTVFDTGPSFSDVDSTYSATEATTVPDTISDQGVAIAGGYIAAAATVKGAISQKASYRYPITLNRAGAHRDFGTMTLICKAASSTSVVRARFNIAEVR